MGQKDDPGPWHLVNAWTGEHVGPFSTALDVAMARSIAEGHWRDAKAMDLKTFLQHLKNPSERKQH